MTKPTDEPQSRTMKKWTPSPWAYFTGLETIGIMMNGTWKSVSESVSVSYSLSCERERRRRDLVFPGP